MCVTPASQINLKLSNMHNFSWKELRMAQCLRRYLCNGM